MLVFRCSWFILIVCACSTLAAPPMKQVFDLDDEAQLVHMFNDFKQEYKKTYHSSEHSKRFQIFVENLAEINVMNERDPFATYGINEFTDMTTEEFEAAHTGYVPASGTSFLPTVVVNATEVPNLEIPKQFDWRDHNVVTSVKDQGDCGSCWAFGAIGNIEGQYALKHKELVDFSPQQLNSCDHFFANGCDGGDYSMAFIYLMLSGGLETEKDYPYTSGNGDNGICKFDKKKVKVTLANVNQYDFSTMTEDKVAQLLVATGPLSIGLAAKPHLLAYNGGIMSKDSCNDSKVNHAVLLVGYGEENGVPYWLVKNSWGAKKGENGYFRMQRGVNCLNFMEAFGASAVVN